MKSTLIKAAKAAGKVVMENYGDVGKLKYKGPRDVVTKADFLSEKTIMDTIKKKFPSHNFLTEESGIIKKNSEYTWIIDPIDGTTNFVSKIPYFAVSIALAKNDEVLMGVVFNPCTDEMYFAEKGKGAYLNGNKLRVSKENKFMDSIITFSLPHEIKLSQKTLSILSRNYGTFRAVRNFGSAALNLCYVAEEKFDLYFSLDIKAWDVAAAKLIVEEAQGKITNINNKRWNLNDKTIVASNKILHNKFIRLLK